jgi:hypothetical protein
MSNSRIPISPHNPLADACPQPSETSRQGWPIGPAGLDPVNHGVREAPGSPPSPLAASPASATHLPDPENPSQPPGTDNAVAGASRQASGQFAFAGM